MSDVLTQLNQPLKPTMLNKIMMFHDLDLGPEVSVLLEHNPVLSCTVFHELDNSLSVV